MTLPQLSGYLSIPARITLAGDGDRRRQAASL